MKHDVMRLVENPAWGQTPVVRVDVERYTSAKHVELERACLWPHVWQIACREEEISQVGDYFEYEIGDQSVLVTRTSAGLVKAYYNACLHRGTQLAKGCGNLPQFTCPFHGWRWSLEGTNLHVQDRTDFPGLSEANLRLPECRVGLWGGFVFLKLTEGGPSLDEYLSPVAEQLAPYRIQDYRIQSWRTIIVKANWKVALEAFEESYHIPTTHPQGVTATDDVGTIYDNIGIHSRSIIPNAKPSPRVNSEVSEEEVLRDSIDQLLDVKLASERERVLFEELRDKPLPPGMTTRKFFQQMAQQRFSSFMPDLTGDQYLNIWDYTLFPNFVFNALPGHVFGFLARPNGSDPDSCIFDVIALQHPCGEVKQPPKRQTITDPNYDWGLALGQDWRNLALMQKGLHARTMKQTRLASFQEKRVANRAKVIGQYYDENRGRG